MLYVVCYMLYVVCYCMTHSFTFFHILSVGWGNSNLHLLPGVDPGKWSDHQAKNFSNQFDDVAPPLPSDDWIVTAPWSYTTTQGDPEGYQYATK